MLNERYDVSIIHLMTHADFVFQFHDSVCVLYVMHQVHVYIDVRAFFEISTFSEKAASAMLCNMETYHSSDFGNNLYILSLYAKYWPAFFCVTLRVLKPVKSDTVDSRDAFWSSSFAFAPFCHVVHIFFVNTIFASSENFKSPRSVCLKPCLD